MTLEVLADYIKGTDYRPIPSRNRFTNLCTRNTYVLEWLLGGMGEKADYRLQNGKGIRAFIMPHEKSTAQWAHPGKQLQLKNPQVLMDHTQDWRFLVDQLMISDPEAELNGNAPVSEQLIDIMGPKEERLAMSMSHAWEDSLGAIPSYADMESSSGALQPMSAFAFVTEDDGVAPMWGNNNVMGLDTTVYDKWDNTRAGYARLSSDQSGTGRTLQQALSEATRKSKFKTLPVSMFANADRQETTTPRAWFTTEWGIEQYEENVLKHSHDPLLMAAKQDLAVESPVHKNIPIVWWERMDEVELYADGSGYGNEKNCDVEGPRFLGWNRMVLHPVLHSKKYFEKGSPMRIHDQPMDMVTWRHTWLNLTCTDRRSCAWVYPTVAQTVPA